MLRLNHATLPVTEVAALRDFFVRHFAFTEIATRGSAASNRENRWTQSSFADRPSI